MPIPGTFYIYRSPKGMRTFDYEIGWSSEMLGPGGDARDGAAAVFDLQLHFGRAAGLQGKPAAGDSRDGGCGAGVGSHFDAIYANSGRPLVRAGED